MPLPIQRLPVQYDFIKRILLVADGACSLNNVLIRASIRDVLAESELRLEN